MDLPPSHGVSSGLQFRADMKRQTAYSGHILTRKEQEWQSWISKCKQLNQRTPIGKYPKMTAFHSIMLLSWGAPLMPAGGSCCSLLKSLINLFLAGVDIVAHYLWSSRSKSAKQNMITASWLVKHGHQKTESNDESPQSSDVKNFRNKRESQIVSNSSSLNSSAYC